MRITAKSRDHSTRKHGRNIALCVKCAAAASITQICVPFGVLIVHLHSVLRHLPLTPVSSFKMNTPERAVLTRRLFLMGTPLFLAGCTATARNSSGPVTGITSVPSHYANMYAAMPHERFPIPAPDITKVDPKFWRQEVAYASQHPVGTIVVDTDARFLYLQLENGRAMRYGIGVGKAGLEFEGQAVVQFKREWPRWTPTMDMMRREPARYGHLAGGMEPGLNNPLGPRALYLFRNGVDTLYRIHGTNEDWSIGKSVSSGCIRMFNQDVIDLYNRVPNGSRVVVLQSSRPSA